MADNERATDAQSLKLRSVAFAKAATLAIAILIFSPILLIISPLFIPTCGETSYKDVFEFRYKSRWQIVGNVFAIAIAAILFLAWAALCIYCYYYLIRYIRHGSW